MSHFRERFEACVSELERHPRIWVTHHWLGPPASETELAAVETALGPLPPSVRAFYAATNGVQLRWIDRESPHYTDQDENAGVACSAFVPRMAADAQGGDGLVDIGPIETLLEAEDLYSDGDEVRAFDTIDDLGMVAFARGTAVTTRLRIGSDHNVCWDELPFEFSDYVELLVDTYGHAERRRAACFGKQPTKAVSLESLLWPAPLSPRALAQGHARIDFEDERYSSVRLRGTAVSLHPRGNDSTSLLRVHTDLGEDIYLARRLASPVAEPPDAYERVRQNPSAFLAAISQVSPVTARGMFGGVWGARGQSRVRDSHFPIALSPEVWRVVGLFSPVAPTEVVPELAKILLGWLGEAKSGTNQGQILAISDLSETLTAVLGRAMPERMPQTILRQLADLATAADTYGASFPRTPSPPFLSEHATYWRSVVAGTAVPLQTPKSHKLGASLGLLGFPLLD